MELPTTITATDLQIGDTIVRSTKAGTVIRITIENVWKEDHAAYSAIGWTGVSANATPRTGLFGLDEKVKVLR